jgi:cold shock CspA family protein
MAEIRYGEVVSWQEERGFGFVIDYDTDEEFFVHASTLRGGGIEQSFHCKGLKISFEVAEQNGKTRAVKVKKIQ